MYKLFASHHENSKELIFTGTLKDCEKYQKNYNHEQVFRVDYHIELT